MGPSRPLSANENRRTNRVDLAELPMKAPGKAKSSRGLAKIEQPHEGGSSDPSVRTPLRPTGIRVMGDMPWGSHICLFYETKTDLLDANALYIKAGLDSNEYCVWAISEPITEDEAWAVLIRARFIHSRASRSTQRRLWPVDGRLKAMTVIAPKHRKGAAWVKFENPLDVGVMAIDGTWCRDCHLTQVSETEAQIRLIGPPLNDTEIFSAANGIWQPSISDVYKQMGQRHVDWRFVPQGFGRGLLAQLRREAAGLFKVT